MKANMVSKRYASAFYDFLKGSVSLENVLRELGQLVELIDSDKNVNLFVKSPLIKTEEKLSFVETLKARDFVSAELSNFMKLLIQKNRLFLLPEVYEYMKYLEMEDKGEVCAEVTVAAEVDEDVEESIKKSLESVSGKKIVLDIKKDASIIGGFVAKIKSNQLDASVRGQLTKLRESLLG